MQRTSSSDLPPPTLPPRPGGRPLKPVPPAPVDAPGLLEPDAVYDDCNESNGIPPKPDDVYDDFDEENVPPPPLPPHPEAFYDDVGEQQSPPPLPPQRPQPPVPLMSPPQDTYDDVGGPIVQQLPKRQLPPAPVLPTPAAATKPAASVYEFDDGNDELDAQNQPPLPPPPPPEDSSRIYEVAPEPSEPVSAAPQAPAPPPHLPPKHPGPLKPSPQPAKPINSPGPKAGAPPAGFGMNQSMLQNAIGGLRKVSVDSAASDSSHDPKVYGECPDTVYDAKKVFENRGEKKPDILSPKPQVGGTKVPKPNSKSPGPRPAPAPQQAKGTPQRVPEIVSLPKVGQGKDKHPSPSAPAAQKPASGFEPKQEELEAPDEIYDDASSVVLDPLDRYDWYHGKIERGEGERRVQAVAKDGTFLVRISGKDPNFPFTLVVLHNKQVNNLQIRERPDSKVALGKEKTGEVAFQDVPAMIEHHRQHPVVLLGSNQSQVKLQHSPRKS